MKIAFRHGGYLAERAAGIAFGDFVSSHILAPLAMASSAFANPCRGRSEHAWPHGLPRFSGAGSVQVGPGRPCPHRIPTTGSPNIRNWGKPSISSCIRPTPSR
jgi:CubicO group peptidase (beta-lactamase class C family)